jgi:hypothetical protein
MVNKKNKRNSFVALCEYASQNNWCWKMSCTTCGHGAFKVAFSKIVHKEHPDDDSFWPYGKSNSDSLREVDNYRDFWSEASIVNQINLVSIVAQAKISEIRVIAKFPDWLGYIGLVINHCSSLEARKIISDSFLPQFIVMLKNDKEICNYLKNKLVQQELLSMNDLSRIENKTVDLKNPPMPLILDIL